MGCANSTDSPLPGTVSERRRRLSISKVQQPEHTLPDETDGLEVARGMLTEIAERNLLDMIQDHPGDTPRRKYSLGSETDKDLNLRSSFASKTVTHEGDPPDVEQKTIGFACKKGLKPESPNQDSWCVIKVEKDFSIYAVFDGHGAKGHDISDFVRSNFPKVLVNCDEFQSDPLVALKNTYMQIQNMIEVQTKTGKLNATFSGSTVSVILHRYTDGKLFVSHVGDSRCVLGRKQDDNFLGVPLTLDHKPDDVEERQRIEGRGGRVVFDGFANFRVYAQGGGYPGLNMSRALGDLMGYYDAGISAEPSLSEVQVRPNDFVLLLCSDGVWEFISDQEAIELTLPFLTGTKKDAQKAAEKVAKEAWDRWMKEEDGAVVDDITAVVVFLDDERQANPDTLEI